MVLNAAGNAAVAESRHFPYGGVRWSEGEVPTDYRWTGQRVDPSIQLYFMGARQLDPALGRWISADTIIPDPQNPQSLNRYSYVNGRPLGFTDPTGHYMKNVHQDLTQQIATKVANRVTMMRGLVVLPEEEGRLGAATIAWADQNVDANSKTSPKNPINEAPERKGRSIAEYYHFISRKEANGRLEEAIKAKDVVAFGTALHAYQDYWSHTRKGFSVPAGQDGIDRIHQVCPECSSLYSKEELESRAKWIGHAGFTWNDKYEPPDLDDLYMSQGVEYWLVLFYCELYGVDVEDYWALYGSTEPEKASGEQEPQ